MACITAGRPPPAPAARGLSLPLGTALGPGRPALFDVSLAGFSGAGAAVSLGLLQQWHQQGLLEGPVALARRLADHLGLPQPVGSVVSVPVQANADAVRDELAAAGIKGAVRAGSVRPSPHVHHNAPP